MPRTETPGATEISSLDWFSAHGASKLRGRIRAPSPELVAFINFIWPHGLDYFSPLNPVFVSEALDAAALNSHSIWFARDGLVPLLWYFRAHPKPSGLKARILVHEEIMPYVPSSWRSHVSGWRIESTIEASRPAGQVLLTGLMMDTYCSLDALQKQLETLVARRGASIRKTEFLALLPCRIDGFGNEHRHEFLPDFMVRVCRALGTRIRAMSWAQFESMDSFRGVEVIDLNEGLLCRDSYVVQRTLSRGASIVSPASKRASRGARGQELIELSPYHGVRILPASAFPKLHPDDRVGKSLDEHFSGFELAMRSEANRRFPWPQWMLGWSRGTIAGE
jgi:hypothetical protein